MKKIIVSIFILILFVNLTGCCKKQNTKKKKNVNIPKSTYLFLDKIKNSNDCIKLLSEYKLISSKLDEKEKNLVIKRVSELLKNNLEKLFQYYNYSLTLNNENMIAKNILDTLKNTKKNSTIISGCLVLGKICNHFKKYKPEILRKIKDIDIGILTKNEKEKIKVIASELIKNEDPESDYNDLHLKIAQKLNAASMLIDQAIINEKDNEEYSKRIYLKIVNGNFDNEERSIAAFNLAQTYFEDTSEDQLIKNKAKEYYEKALEFSPDFVLKDEVINKIRILNGLKPLTEDDENDLDEDETN